jgi:probable rRNA maturation factor
MELVLEIGNETEGYEEKIDISSIEEYIKGVLEEEYPEAKKPVYISILLTDNENIQIVNRDYRGKDSPTDVISFAYHETEFEVGPYDTLGDIVISLERVEEQAKDYGHNFQREFYYVLTHGVLHLLGYDHIEDEDKDIMREKEEEILKKHGYTRD